MQDLINAQEKEIARLRQANARRIKKPPAESLKIYTQSIWTGITKWQQEKC